MTGTIWERSLGRFELRAYNAETGKQVTQTYADPSRENGASIAHAKRQLAWLVSDDAQGTFAANVAEHLARIRQGRSEDPLSGVESLGPFHSKAQHLAEMAAALRILQRATQRPRARRRQVVTPSRSLGRVEQGRCPVSAVLSGDTRERRGPMAEPARDRSRVRPTYVLDERELLNGWLEFHRATLLAKCDGLDDAQRKARPIPTSDLSLHGLVRHMAETERNWFGRILLRDPATPWIWDNPAVSDSALLAIDSCQLGCGPRRLAERVSRQLGCSESLRPRLHRRVANETDLPDSIYLHMIQEYARHNGHADLIRELLDGSVGL